MKSLKDKLKNFGHEDDNNWDIVKKRKATDTLRNRDVYNQQQLKRGKEQKPQTMTSRLIFIGIFAILAGIASMLVIGICQYGLAVINNMGKKGFDIDKLNLIYFLLAINKPKLLGFIVCGGLVFAFMYPIAQRNLAAQNATTDNSDINTYTDDQHIALPEEIMRKFPPFPDAGAHSWESVSSMISHAALLNKGIKTVEMTKRYGDDMLEVKGTDKLVPVKEAKKKGLKGEIVAYKGEPIYDDDGSRVKEKLPMFDKKYMEALFTASGDPHDKNIRRYFDARKIPYNPGGKNRDRYGAGDKNAPKTWADFINEDWEIPDYETQRPGGVYLVDTDPVNTMVLAITRAGKGQTVIEPTIDMWTREKRPSNMLMNDPKGELLKKFYVPGTYRGFQIVQFNLINVLNTDIYNPLVLAATAAQEGNFAKCSTYVENIADVFFPTEGQSDPFWPTAANNAFKRVAFGLIDYYLEESKEIRLRGQAKGIDERVIDTQIDHMWGKVTLYNCYQFFVRLSSKKIKNPINKLKEDDKSGKVSEEVKDKLADRGIDEDSPVFDQEKQKMLQEMSDKAKKEAELWNDQPEIDELSLYFNATDLLPRNSMRDLVTNANNSLKAMGGSDKTISSVYGIAITSMAFFTDPTISTLTSGTPSQNVDLAGISFPRRIGFRFAADFAKKNHLVGQQAVWQAYSDPEFKESLGPEFYHEGQINSTLWALFYFKGIFPKQAAYLKCTTRNMMTQMETHEFYFKFVKNFQTNLSGRTYLKDPILGTKIIRDGTLYEMRPAGNKYCIGHSVFKTTQLVDISAAMHTAEVNMPIVQQTMVRYTEKPKMIFVVTPPHLMSYAKIILILIKQLVDLNFEQSYMTKGNQKPLYKMKFMLDELGNLQSSGHGISGFQTMLSIGLGQDQQFTLILQTLQQLRDVYGDSVDKIIQGNTSNIVFLKSTDDSLIETLEKMSGKTHVSKASSKTVTRDLEKIIMQNEGKISTTISTTEVPVISYNDMAYISERNSIVFRAGDSPIWNRNEMILPMSWRLYGNTIKQPGHDYTFATLPTLSTAKDFDVRMNQPNFEDMLHKRLSQALVAGQVEESYKEAYGYTDDQIQKLDPDDYSDEIMRMINVSVNGYESAEDDPNSVDNPENMKYLLGQEDEENSYTDDGSDENAGDDSVSTPHDDSVRNLINSAETNDEQIEAIDKAMQQVKHLQEKKFVDGTIAPIDLVDKGGAVSHNLDERLIRIFTTRPGDFKQDDENFIVDKDGSLWDSQHEYCYIKAGDKSIQRKAEDMLNDAKKEKDKKVFENDQGAIDSLPRSYEVNDSFYRFLAKQDSWLNIANGAIEQELARDNDNIG